MTDEKVYLETELAIVDGGVAKVRITNRRAVLGEKTYSLQNIAAVEAYSNAAKVTQLNANAEAVYEEALRVHKANAVSTEKLVGGILLIGAGVVMMCSSIAGGGDEAASIVPTTLMCCLLPGGALIATAFQKSPPPEGPVPLKPFWSVRISAAGTSTNVIQSLDEQDIRKVVDALNDAIIESNS